MDTCEIYAYRLLSIIKLSFEILQMMMWLSCFLHYILWMDHLIPNLRKIIWIYSLFLLKIIIIIIWIGDPKLDNNYKLI